MTVVRLVNTTCHVV